MSVEKVNLIPPARVSSIRVRRRVRTWSVASAGYAMLAVGACLTMASERAEGPGARSDLDRLQRTLEARKADLKNARAQAADFQRRVDAADWVTKHPDWSVLLRMLASLRGSDVMLGAIALEPLPEAPPDAAKPAPKAGVRPASEAYTLHVEGTAREQLSVADFAQALQDSGVFRGVRLVDSKAEVEGEVSVVRFRLICDLGDRELAGGRKQP